MIWKLFFQQHTGLLLLLPRGVQVDTKTGNLYLLMEPCSDLNVNQGKMKWIVLEGQRFLFEWSVDPHLELLWRRFQSPTSDVNGKRKMGIEFRRRRHLSFPLSYQKAQSNLLSLRAAHLPPL